MTIDRDTIARMADTIATSIRRTPVIEIAMPGLRHPVVLKLEQLQHTGSFKARGAFANLLGRDVPEAGIAAASGGNHGAAAAYAAQKLGVRARIFVPAIAAPAKAARIAGYGATIVQRGENYYAALEYCLAYVKESGAVNIHAYDEAPALIGQGTLAKEIEEQAPSLDTLLVGVGGGGLIGGIAAWYENRVRVVGIEPQTCNSLHAALAAGKPVTVTPSGIAADSLGASFAGSLMFPIAQKYVSEVALISDEDIAGAQRYLWRELRLVTEPGGAAAFAALLSGAYRPQRDERVGVILCGANTDPETFAKVVAT